MFQAFILKCRINNYVIQLRTPFKDKADLDNYIQFHQKRMFSDAALVEFKLHNMLGNKKQDSTSLHLC